MNEKDIPRPLHNYPVNKRYFYKIIVPDIAHENIKDL